MESAARRGVSEETMRSKTKAWVGSESLSQGPARVTRHFKFELPFIHECIYIYTQHIQIHVCIHRYVCTYAYTYTHMCVHIHKYIYAYIYVHTNTPLVGPVEG